MDKTVLKRKLFGKLLPRLRRIGLNIKKTKVMTTVGLQEFKLEDDHIKILHYFNFLGSIICDDADREKEIWRRLAMGGSTMTKLAKIMKDDNISLATKTKLVYFVVFPVVTYDSESRILLKTDQQRLKSSKMWTWRRLQRISWTAKNTND